MALCVSWSNFIMNHCILIDMANLRNKIGFTYVGNVDHIIKGGAS